MANWIDNAVFYHIYPLGFCGAPHKNEGGDTVSRILKVIDWIPHLKEMNINAVYFGPVFESAEHGYDTSDYMQIDRRLGTNDDFARVCRALHENGIRVVLDGVFNHVGREFWAFRDIREKGSSSPYCGWFANLNFGGNSPMGDNFWYEGWEGHYNLVKLNLKNPDVVNHLLSAIDFWKNEFDIDGIRFDVAYCLDFDFLRCVHNHCKSKYNDFWLLGEVVHGDYSRWANNEMLDSVTNYECYKGLYSSINDKNYFEIAHSIRRLIGDGGIVADRKLYNFVDNHDVDRVASRLTNPDTIYNLYTLLFTMPGCPSVYYGSEWALTDKKDGTDYPLRPCLELDKMPENPLVDHIAKLSHAKQTLGALQNGRLEQIHLGNREFAFKRTGGGADVFVLLNINDSEYTFNFDHGSDTLIDILSGDTFDRNTAVLVCANRARVLVDSGSAAGVDTKRENAVNTDKKEVIETKQEPVEMPKSKPREYKIAERETPKPENKSNKLERTVLNKIEIANSSDIKLIFKHPITAVLMGSIICRNFTAVEKEAQLPSVAEKIETGDTSLTVTLGGDKQIRIKCENIIQE